MFRGVNPDGFCPKESGPPAGDAGCGIASLKHEHAASSWFSVFSVLSRPALSFLHKYLPGRLQTAAFSGAVSGWINEGIPPAVDRKSSFVEQLNFLSSNEHPRLSYVHCQHEGTGFCAASLESVYWLKAESFHELGIHDDNAAAHAVDLNIRRDTSTWGYFASAKKFFSQFFMNAVWAQKETKGTEQGAGGPAWFADCMVPQPGNWWGETGGKGNQEWPSNISRGAGPNLQCGENSSGSQQVMCRLASPVAKPTELFEQRERRESKQSESAGLSCHNRQMDNGSSHMARPGCLPNSEKPLLNYLHLCANAETVTACQSEVAVLTPDQDNGYSSLEEEHSNARLRAMNPFCFGQGCTEGIGATAEQGCSTEVALNEEAAGEAAEWEKDGGVEQSSLSESGDDELPAEEEVERQAQSVLSLPKCQNKAIAYIMGMPCSEESDIESDGDCSWDTDDDGFDSEGTSEFSDSEVSDEEDDGEEDRGSDVDETDAEVERLWNSLCQSRDPYSPRNFTAALRTAPDLVPEAAACATRDIVESPSFLESPFSSPKPLISDDESGEEASDTDEAESLRLWNSFNCVSDPYNPLNFQAPLRTRLSARGSRNSPSASSSHKKVAEEQLDSGFSEDGSLPKRCFTKLKKVRFVEEVEEFYVSCEEDRRGPWEEFARDRCRFLRRVQETEDVIGYCLAPTYRLLIFQKMHQSC